MANYTRIGTASLRQVPFDFEGNAKNILSAVKKAYCAQINVLLLPELVLTGYGCEDNFTYQEFHQASEQCLEHVISGIADIHQKVNAGNESAQALLVILGLPIMYPGGQVFNATAVLSFQGLHGFSCKQFLARSGLHYEPRWFEAWQRGKIVNHPKYNVPMGDIVVDCQGIRIGFETCEDSWISNRPGRDLYQRNVDLILNPSASHYAIGKYATREQFVKEGSRAFGVVYAYANLNGTENGTSIFDAGCLIASEGEIVSYGDRLNVRDVLINQTLVNISANRVSRIVSSETITNDDSNTLKLDINLSVNHDTLDFEQLNKVNMAANDTIADFWHELRDEDLQFAEICHAIGNGLWDWMIRTQTSGFIVSLSGGADSGLAASLVYLSQCIALNQLDTESYFKKLPTTVTSKTSIWEKGASTKHEWLINSVMPELLVCLYQGTDNSSNTTFSAADALAQNLGATFHNWNIQPLVQQYSDMVNELYPSDPLSWEQDDITLQNIQARSRSPGVWMIANRENKLLIATSNLSESALGYATMDGDTSGVLSALSGLSKTTIRKLLVWLEIEGVPIRWDNGFQRYRIEALKKINAQQPTAELRPDKQTDEEDLMPYEICDFIMECYLIKQMWPKSIFVELAIHEFANKYEKRQLGAFIERWFNLFCRNPWKRYGTRAGFHIEQISLDPKSFHRFPLLNSGFKQPLKDMWEFIELQQ